MTQSSYQGWVEREVDRGNFPEDLLVTLAKTIARQLQMAQAGLTENTLRSRCSMTEFTCKASLYYLKRNGYIRVKGPAKQYVLTKKGEEFAPEITQSQLRQRSKRPARR